MTFKSFAGGAIDTSAVSAPLGDRLHVDHAPVDLPHLNDTVVEPLSCLFDCRGSSGQPTIVGGAAT
jgi:hypothetical protein